MRDFWQHRGLAQRSVVILEQRQGNVGKNRRTMDIKTCHLFPEQFFHVFIRPRRKCTRPLGPITLVIISFYSSSRCPVPIWNVHKVRGDAEKFNRREKNDTQVLGGYLKYQKSKGTYLRHSQRANLNYFLDKIFKNMRYFGRIRLLIGLDSTGAKTFHR